MAVCSRFVENIEVSSIRRKIAILLIFVPFDIVMISTELSEQKPFKVDENHILYSRIAHGKNNT